jgi:hypothetical protein
MQLVEHYHWLFLKDPLNNLVVLILSVQPRRILIMRDKFHAILQIKLIGRNNKNKTVSRKMLTPKLRMP